MNESGDGSSKNLPNDDTRFAALALAITSIEARVKVLEKPEEKTYLSRIQKNVSFLALVIGIFLSCISLFDVFWSKPREALFRDIEEFNKSVNSVSELRQQLLKTQYESRNTQLTFAMNSMITPQVLANIQYATALLPRLDEHAGIPQLLVLISEAMNIYDWKSAEILVDRAVNSQDALPSMLSEALRYKARLMFVTGRDEEGRKSFQAALDALANETVIGIDGNRAYIISDWALYEYALGDCSEGTKRTRQFSELISQTKIYAPMRQGMIETFKEQLQNNSTTCTILTELNDLH